jgi:hypothetical protein
MLKLENFGNNIIQLIKLVKIIRIIVFGCKFYKLSKIKINFILKIIFSFFI